MNALSNTAPWSCTFSCGFQALAVTGGLLAGVLIVLVACLCNRSRRTRFRCRRSAIRSSIRRASLYLSSTNPLELSVSELLFNLTGGVTEQAHQHQTPSSTLNKQLSPPVSAFHGNSTKFPHSPPSYPPPPPPTHRGRKQPRRQRYSLDQSTAEERGKGKRTRRNVSPGKSREGPVGVYQSTSEMMTMTPRRVVNTALKPPPKDSINERKNITRQHKEHATLHRTDIGTPEHSSRRKENCHLTSHPAGHSGAAWHTSTLPLPDPPAECPDVFASLISTINTPIELGKLSAPATHSLGSRSRRASKGARSPQ